MNIDKNTFGKSKAAEVLTKLLNEVGDEKLSRRVCRLFTMYSQGARAIVNAVEDPHLRHSLASLWCEREKQKVLRATMPEDIRSYLLNIEVAVLRDIRKSCCGARLIREGGTVMNDIKAIKFPEGENDPLTKWDKAHLWWYEHEPRIFRVVRGWIGSLRMRFVIRPYLIDTRLYRWGWHDADSRMLHGMMRLLKEFVDDEKGLEHCDWDANEGDAKIRDEIVTIRNWWIDYPDRLRQIELATHRWHEAKFGDTEDFDEHIKIINSPDSEEVKKLFKVHVDMEKELEAEETDMLTRLVKIRGYLWT